MEFIQEIKKRKRNFVIQSILFWIILLSYPAGIWLATKIALGEPKWIGWKWTISIYILGLVFYIITKYLFETSYRELIAEVNRETPHTQVNVQNGSNIK